MNATLEKQINKMTLEELVELHDAAGKLIKNFQKDRRKELQKQFKEMAAQAGFSLSEVVGGRGAAAAAAVVSVEGKRRNYKPKYQNPANPSQTWTGLGMKPRWVRDHLAEGKSIDDLRIPDAE